MEENIFRIKFAHFTVALCLLAGTASPLKGYSHGQEKSEKPFDILVAAKTFNKNDCMRYLGRNVLKVGYQPVQIIIKNTSNKTLIFSPNQVSLPCARVEQISEKVHTSTAGRATGYGAAAVLTSGLFLIPAIVDGVKSSNANRALDADYFAKALSKQTLPPNSKLNGLLFVPSSSYVSDFKITLIEEGTNKAYEMPVKLY